MNPIAFKIGPLTVYWYGILIVIGVLAGAGVSGLQARKRHQDPEHVWNGLLVCLILGIVGARVYHVLSISKGGAIGWLYYRDHPSDMLKIWQGGLGLIGAIIGGTLGLALYAKLSKLPVLTWLDIGTYGLLLATAIGRWGNYINQELYGPPTTLPWGIRIAPLYRIIPFNDLLTYPPEVRFHPVFLYESLWCLLGFGVMWRISHRWRNALHEGDVFLLYLIWYSLGRFLVEFLRPDAWMMGPIAAAQVFTAISFVVAVALLIYRHFLPAAETADSSQAESQGMT